MSLVAIDSLGKSYDEVEALSEFSMTVDQGQIVALVGPDGAGKTTLMRILCNLVLPEKGTVEIAGRDVVTQFDQIKNRVGYMPQTFSLYRDLSVNENLTFYAGIYGHTGSEYKATRDRLYEFSQLGPFAKRRAGDLSGGMKQKLALSCALLHQPDILILDEPTTGVDPLSRRLFWDMLFELRGQGVTILVSTPYMDEAARSDWTCFIFGGQKLTEGTPVELAAQFEGSVYLAEKEPSIELVNSLSELDGVTARKQGVGLQVYLSKGITLSQAVDQFGSMVDPDLLQPVPPSLEDRFIQLMEARV